MTHPLFVADHSALHRRYAVVSTRDRVRPHSAPSSPQRAPSSPQRAPISPQSTPSSPQRIVERVAGSRWAPARDVRIAILSLCERTYRTVAELADLLNRKATTLQQNYVSKMLAEGLLELKYPETPNHPSQAYRARHPHEGEEA